ncbi:hypothetical protein COL26_21950 [Bacillus thuringiensis]|uniref:Phage protein n=1 Tax=Bacillus thuringiensis TaxID=1428 RepID=A0ABD6RUG4_BACTU|nr:hypothetical protein [Bacillus thuringiensis]PER40825.1 hypothetical protein CN495_33340 [Bacillus thuringiensis]PEU85304.1 hypothetical protein CN411_21040 [Bacillus thuringiensis]PFI05795.1 hypothetical protein COI79_24465 [Bacillus thuringiensis]PFW34630.1 hypothetical protein COL26_21950 [Bacillus thuringiensis]PGY81676.1 hypothetical protein COE44_06335 [Bacillus thuringiensis]
MKFWAIAYQFDEDSFYDFATNEDTYDLKESCFMPTKEMAETFIEDELSIQYVPVEIEVETLQKNGIWSYTRGRVERWDEDFE